MSQVHNKRQKQKIQQSSLCILYFYASIHFKEQAPGMEFVYAYHFLPLQLSYKMMLLFVTLIIIQSVKIYCVALQRTWKIDWRKRSSMQIYVLLPPRSIFINFTIFDAYPKNYISLFGTPIYYNQMVYNVHKMFYIIAQYYELAIYKSEHLSAANDAKTIYDSNRFIFFAISVIEHVLAWKLCFMERT